jgi:hypothetical protein
MLEQVAVALDKVALGLLDRIEASALHQVYLRARLIVAAAGRSVASLDNAQTQPAPRCSHLNGTPLAGLLECTLDRAVRLDLPQAAGSRCGDQAAAELAVARLSGAASCPEEPLIALALSALRDEPSTA